ncbi:MAG: sulfurtransferase [Bacteroidetes bacterium]|nr:sulfurtransferase [Bacteroidota bacterium]
MNWAGLLLLASMIFQTSSALPRQIPHFVSTEWLSKHINDADLVVLHVGFNRPEYMSGHIPSARFLWTDWLAISTPDASTEMPLLAHADTILENLGVTDGSTIILYHTGSSITMTTRMLLALSYFGFGDQVAVLDGGLERWKAEHRPLSTERPEVRRTSLTLHVDASSIVDAKWLKENLENPSVAIVDARDRRFYDGNGGGFARTGHIKGARSIPFSSVVDSTNKMKSVTELQRLFGEAGVQKGMKVVTYCHVGQQATLVYAAAKLLGYDAAVYDGSFQEWNMRGEEYPVERP